VSKNRQYLKYVLRHKWFVFQKCCDYGLFWQGIIHDLSKFGLAEWGPYVDKFYGGPYPERNYGDIRAHFGDTCTQPWVDRRFDEAWLHHQRHNPHHWQHWVLREDDGETKCLEMPRKYMLEMIADWWGAGRAIHGEPDGIYAEYFELRKWYLANRDKIQLHDRTRFEVERIMGLREEDKTWPVWERCP
jgi:hypothetical protein